ncbi:MAG: hypothetical protein H0V82_10270 [Candidatus Protochlamydia sp.]|nr:hypothetical protein [Candidatus Protochlamydia sp.]
MSIPSINVRFQDQVQVSEIKTEPDPALKKARSASLSSSVKSEGVKKNDVIASKPLLTRQRSTSNLETNSLGKATSLKSLNGALNKKNDGPTTTNSSPMKMKLDLSFVESSKGFEDKEFEVQMEIMNKTFHKTEPAQIKEIYVRLVKYAEACDIKPDEMFKKIEEGRKVAENINDGKMDKGTVNDVINFDWFTRSHMAKQDQLFLKGTE